MAQAYQNDTLTRASQAVMVSHIASSGEDSANSAAITVNELTTITQVFGVQIVSTTGVHRNPQGTVTFTGNVVTIADSGLAVSEIIKFTAVAVS